VDNITPGRHDEFFERFYRSDASRNQKTGGHGIGLSVAHAIVMAHKGKISAKSEDGHSLSIHVTL
jgi:signal transduction histidine kinase